MKPYLLDIRQILPINILLYLNFLECVFFSMLFPPKVELIKKLLLRIAKLGHIYLTILFNGLLYFAGFPWWLSSKELTCQCKRHRFYPWVRKMPWRRKWQHTPVFLPGEFHGQRRLVGYSPRGCERVRYDL